MLKISLVGDKQLIARLDSMPEKLRAALYRKVTAFALKLEAKVKNEKLSGGVLNVKSGNLRRSIASQVEQSTSAIVGRVFSSGDVKYAAIHEYGGVIHHPGGTPYFIGAKGGILNGKAIFVHKDTAFSQHLPVTKPHTINMPERSFLRSSLREMSEEITQGLNETVMEALKS